MALFKVNKDQDTGRESLMVFFETDGETKVIEDDNPNFRKILDVLESNRAGDKHNEESESLVRSLLNPFSATADKLTALSDRVTYSDCQVFYNNEPVDSEIADVIIDTVNHNEGKGVSALVNFLEKLYSSATETARRNLFRWITHNEITLMPDGNFVAYKGLEKFTKNEETKFRSAFSGRAYVNNTLITGKIVQDKGDVVTMPRSEVEEDENVPCAPGLHAGTYSYASGWQRGGFFTVSINPADVVSVPLYNSGQKLRTSRYTILDACEKEYTAPVWEDPEYVDDEEYVDDSAYWDEYYEDEDETPVDAGIKFAYDNKDTHSLGFFYHDKYRVLKVEEHDADRVYGVDTNEDNVYKVFLINKMSNVEVLVDENEDNDNLHNETSVNVLLTFVGINSRNLPNNRFRLNADTGYGKKTAYVYTNDKGQADFNVQAGWSLVDGEYEVSVYNDNTGELVDTVLVTVGDVDSSDDTSDNSPQDSTAKFFKDLASKGLSSDIDFAGFAAKVEEKGDEFIDNLMNRFYNRNKDEEN